MNRRELLEQCARGVGVMALGPWGMNLAGAREKSTQPPNVIVILADDQGAGDASTHPHLQAIYTPNLERLAASGITFTQGYAGCAMCTPSRAGMLTGKYHGRLGMYDVTGDAGVGFPAKEKTAAEYFKQLGYRTGCIGKWHVGGDIPGFEYNRPLNRGFDRFWGFMGSTHDYWQAHVGSGHTPQGYTSCGFNPIFDQEKVVDHIRYMTHEITRHSLHFIDEHRDRPFFLYVSHHCPHPPLHAPQEVYETYEALDYGLHTTITRAMYQAMDDGIGRLLDRLEDYGLRDNTLIIYSSDNGGGEPSGQLNHIYRGGKFTMMEGGIRAPTLMSWPAGLPENKIYGYPVINIDFLPTMLAAAQGRQNAKFEGVNLLPYLRGIKSDRPHEALFWMMPPSMQEYAVRVGDWKYVQTSVGRGLFNLREDPGELHDLSEAYPDKVRALKQRFEQWNRKNIPSVYTPEIRRKYHEWTQSNPPAETRYDYTQVPYPR